MEIVFESDSECALEQDPPLFEATVASGGRALRVERLGEDLRHVQSLGSLLILAGPFMLCASFFAEQHNPELDRPVGQLAIFLALGGAALHAVAALGARMRSGAT